VKNITLSADETLIRKAREKARTEHRSLNAAFREWLVAWTEGSKRAEGYAELMQRLSAKTQVPRHLTRDELNER
jgi:primosomal protein N'